MSPLADTDAHRHVYGAAPRAGLAIGVVVMLAVGVPAVVRAPTAPSAAVFVFTVAVSAWLVWLWFVRFECSFDPRARTLTVTQFRWPFAPQRTVFGADDCARVTVTRLGARSYARLVGADGRERVLPGGGGAGPDAPTETARVIRRWFALRASD